MHTLTSTLAERAMIESIVPSPGAPATLTVTEAGTRLLADLRGRVAVLDEELFGGVAPLACQQLGEAVLGVARSDMRT